MFSNMFILVFAVIIGMMETKTSSLGQNLLVLIA